jgi:FkbM family methyltransferase
MKTFIDLGTHKFEGLNEFTKKLAIDNNWNVYSFEPNIDIFNESLLIYNEIKHNYNNLYHYNYAVVDYDGIIKFNKHNGAYLKNNITKEYNYIKEYTTGSNALSINPRYDSGNGAIFNIEYIEVQAIDIETLLNNICNNDKNAEIYIKCDIEGSEFKVLPKLLKNKYISNIKQIYIEWHERFWYGTDEYNLRQNEKESIINSFKKNNIECYMHT